MSRKAIQHRIERGRLHRLWWGVYAVGRPEVSERGRWMAAVLTCGPDALLSHRSAAALWGFRLKRSATIEVVVPAHLSPRRRAGIRIHRRAGLDPKSRRVVDRIPVTDPVSTLIDLAAAVGRGELEGAVNEADRLGLIDPEELRDAIDASPSRSGLGRLRTLLDRHTYRQTDSGFERRFLRLVKAVGLPQPETQVWLNGYRRDQVHTAAGLTTLRFSEAQVRHEPEHVRATLAAVAGRLGALP